MEPCKKEGDLVIACMAKTKFVPHCIEVIYAWDKCMANEKLTDATVKLKLHTQPK